MDYSHYLTQINTLTASLGKDHAPPPLDTVQIVYMPRTDLDDTNAVLSALAELEVECGWITWPGNVQSIKRGETPTFNHDFPPLEAELLLKSGNSVRINYRDGFWRWVEISLTPTTSNNANALTDTVCLAAREKSETDLTYQRIWQFDHKTGMTITDAVFTGFKEARACA